MDDEGKRKVEQQETSLVVQEFTTKDNHDKEVPMVTIEDGEIEIVKEIVDVQETDVTEAMRSDIELDLSLHIGEPKLEPLSLAVGAIDHYKPMLLSL